MAIYTQTPAKENKYSTPGFGYLVGKTFELVFRDTSEQEDRIIFLGKSDSYGLWHDQECCEEVFIEDIVGDLDDLRNTPILSAEEVFKDSTPPPLGHDHNESHLWTFYSIRTIKGSVTIRFFGSSNGCYSEEASMHYLTFTGGTSV